MEGKIIYFNPFGFSHKTFCFSPKKGEKGYGETLCSFAKKIKNCGFPKTLAFACKPFVMEITRREKEIKFQGFP